MTSVYYTGIHSDTKNPTTTAREFIIIANKIKPRDNEVLTRIDPDNFTHTELLRVVNWTGAKIIYKSV